MEILSTAGSLNQAALEALKNCHLPAKPVLVGVPGGVVCFRGQKKFFVHVGFTRRLIVLHTVGGFVHSAEIFVETYLFQPKPAYNILVSRNGSAQSGGASLLHARTRETPRQRQDIHPMTEHLALTPGTSLLQTSSS